MSVALLSLVLIPAAAASVELDDELSITATQQLSCTPKIPYFCANIHIACSGQSLIPTFKFTIAIDEDKAVLSATTTKAFLTREHGTISRGSQDAYILFRSVNSRDYVKILADRTFSFRHYTNRGPLMTYGRCK